MSVAGEGKGSPKSDFRVRNEAVLKALLDSCLTAQKDAVSVLYMTLAKQAAESQLSQDKQKMLQAELADLQAKADSIAATLPESDTWDWQHAIEEPGLAHGWPGPRPCLGHLPDKLQSRCSLPLHHH